MAAVVFADLVGFSKKSVTDQLTAKEALTGLLQRLVFPYPRDSRVVLDTGDGAVVGFLVSPEYALGLALRLRRELDTAPLDGMRSEDLRLGINLGPVKLVTDVNGYPNLVGEGINSAERIMGFAGPGETTASRSFREAVYYLDARFQSLFEPLGMRADKHGREHEVFRVTTSKPTIDSALQSLGMPSGSGEARAVADRASPDSTVQRSRTPSGLRTLARVGLVAGLIAVAATASWLIWPRDAPTPPAPALPGQPAATPRPAAPPPTGLTGASGHADQPRQPAQPQPASESPAAAERRSGPDAAAGERVKPPVRQGKSAQAEAPAPGLPRVKESPRVDQAPGGAEDPRTSERCSRLLQRAAIGDVLTPLEQRELTTSCR